MAAFIGLREATLKSKKNLVETLVHRICLILQIKSELMFPYVFYIPQRFVL